MASLPCPEWDNCRDTDVVSCTRSSKDAQEKAVIAAVAVAEDLALPELAPPTLLPPAVKRGSVKSGDSIRSGDSIKRGISIRSGGSIKRGISINGGEVYSENDVQMRWY